MADFLNDSTCSTDAAVAGLGYRFTADLATAQEYDPSFTLLNCAIALKIYALADRARTLASINPAAPSLTLTLGNGLVRPAAGNLAAEQWQHHHYPGPMRCPFGR